ncbi:vacuolar ATPase assembly integral membrane protein vma21 [Basidiobolus ranarum]|uniref:Vacuolar ATPase assembly integral membrane protein vma21 n=1 Tax=Basidiobolus ranarum TaxID=34480 RepID=A0ABR2W3Y8_9FUNG
MTTAEVTPSTVPAPKPKIQVSREVVLKLIFFVIILAVLPVTAYYKALAYFEGNQVYSVGASVIVANVIVFGYVLVAVFEDISDQKAELKDKES